MHHFIRQVLTTLTALMFCFELQAQQSLPIVAWHAMPLDRVNDANVADLSQAGFTHGIFCLFHDKTKQILDCCERQGVKVIFYPQFKSVDMRSFVASTQHREALAGYYLKDEPNFGKVDECRPMLARTRGKKKEAIDYINFLPISDGMKESDYADYLDQAFALPDLKIFSFDYYPFAKEGPRKRWYKNLQMVSERSRRTGKPFWAYILSAGHWFYATPDYAQMSAEAYTNLAYGAKGLCYYTYWQITGGRYQYDRALVDSTGQKSPRYYEAQRLNREVQSHADVFMNTVSDTVWHVGQSLPQVLLSRSGQLVVPYVKSKGECLIGHLVGKDDTYLVLVNKELKSKNTVSLLGQKYRLAPGQGKVLRLLKK